MIADTARFFVNKLGLIGRNSRARTWTYKMGGDKADSMNRVVVLSAVMVVVAAMVGGVGAVSAATADSGATTPGPLFDEDGTTTVESNVTTSDGSNETTTEDSNQTTIEPTTETEDGSDNTIGAGAKLAGVIGAQQAEHSAAVESKAFEKAFDGASSNESKAAVVAQSSERIQDRIQVLENETEALEAAHQNGTISNGTYHGRMTSLTARIQALEHLTNQTSVKSRTLPEAALEARGLSQSDLTALENRTRDATSPKAATIAKQVVGPRAGQPSGPPETVPGHAEDHPGSGNGPQSNATQGDVPGQGSGQNESMKGSRSSNATNAAPGQSANTSSNSPGGKFANQSDSRANNGSSDHQAWFDTNDVNGPSGQNASPGGSNTSGHPVFGNSSALEFVLGFFG